MLYSIFGLKYQCKEAYQHILTSIFFVECFKFKGKASFEVTLNKYTRIAESPYKRFDK